MAFTSVHLLAVISVLVGTHRAQTGKPASGLALSTFGMTLLIGTHWYLSRAG